MLWNSSVIAWGMGANAEHNEGGNGFRLVLPLGRMFVGLRVAFRCIVLASIGVSSVGIVFCRELRTGATILELRILGC